MGPYSTMRYGNSLPFYPPMCPKPPLDNRVTGLIFVLKRQYAWRGDDFQLRCHRDWSRAVVDSASVRAVGGGRTPATDRGKAASICNTDARGSRWPPA